MEDTYGWPTGTSEASRGTPSPILQHLWSQNASQKSQGNALQSVYPHVRRQAFASPPAWGKGQGRAHEKSTQGHHRGKNGIETGHQERVYRATWGTYAAKNSAKRHRIKAQTEIFMFLSVQLRNKNSQQSPNMGATFSALTYPVLLGSRSLHRTGKLMTESAVWGGGGRSSFMLPD